MHARCPQCHQPIEIEDDLELTEITCPSCDSRFNLIGGSTKPFVPDHLATVGRFRLVERIGVGSFGTVFKARDPELDRFVAVKIPRKDQLSVEEAEQFLREARSAAQVNHPNIVGVHEVGRDQERLYIVSDYVEGMTLADWLSATHPTARQAAEFTAQVAEALEHAHESGVIHRDLKPSNIMLDDAGNPRIMDFGLAKRDVGDVTMTVDGHVLGTPAYMSPEQARGDGHQADARSDVYSLGVILYELLTGEKPFRGTSRMLLHQVRNEEPTLPRKLNAAIPRDLETVCMECLEKEPARRYQTAGALAAELRRFLQDEPIHARPVTVWERGWRWARRRPALAGLLLVSGLAAATFVVAMLMAILNVRIARERNAVVKALQQAEEARQQQKDYEYFYLTALANAAWRDGNVGRMKRLLAECPSPQRRWEWHYLNRLGHLDALTIKHPNSVQFLAYAPDRRHLASACLDGVVRVHDAETGAVLHALAGHTRGARSVAFSPDGRRLASSSQDQTVRVWNLEDGRELFCLKGHRGPVASVAFNRDGSRLASTGSDRTVRVWDATSGEELHVLEGHRGPVNRVVFHPTRPRVASAGGDGSIRIWNFETGDLSGLIRAHPRPLQDLAYNRDGSRMASASWDESVRVWETDTRHMIAELRGHKHSVLGVAFNEEGSHVASAGQDQTVRIWDIEEQTEITVLRGHTDWVRSVAFDPQGDRIASASWDNTVKVWDLAQSGGDNCRTIRHGQRIVECATFSPDGERIASVSYGNKPSLRVFHAETGEPAYSIPIQRIRFAAFSPDNATLATGGGDGTVRAWDAATGAPTRTFAGHDDLVNWVAFDGSGDRLAAASRDRTVRVWNTRSGEELLVLQHDAEVRCVAFRPGGSEVATAAADGTIRLFDSHTGAAGRTLEGHSAALGVWSIVFSGDGRRLASASPDRLLKIWDANSGRELATLHGHTNDICRVVFDGSGKRLASASTDRTVKLWDTESGREVLTLAHPNDVYTVEFGPESKDLLTADRAGVIYIWDGRPREEP